MSVYKSMKEKSGLDLFFFSTVIFCFLVIVVRSILVPFAHDEVATFYYFIQPESFIPFHAHIDANGHFLNSFLSWIFFKTLGDAEWSLRLPNVLSFLVLAFALRKLFVSLNSTVAKVLLLSFFLLSFPLLNFYSLCRGYGLSISFFMLGLYYLYVYFQSSSNKNLLFSFVALQLSLSAGLTLLVPLLLILAFVIFFQLQKRIFMRIPTLLLLTTYFILLLFWAKFGFYLKENGALYYGAGESYWKVTFVSLIEMLFGSSLMVKILLGALFFFLFVKFFQVGFRNVFLKWSTSFFVFSFSSLLLLVVGFYVLKVLFGVNYPEDRTGLFYYLYFVVSVVYFAEENKIENKLVSLPFLFFFIVQFFSSFNFSHHAWNFYETMPKRFFTRLVDEQKKQKELITIGGHRVIELFYSYLNYRSDYKLTHILPPEKMQMNCDYYITWKKDKPYYSFYYDKLDEDENSDLVLLKRKEKITRELIYSSAKTIRIQGHQDFTNLLEFNDTLFTSDAPILAEVEFNVLKGNRHLNSWFVLQIDSASGGPNYYFRRTPLDWLNRDWIGTGKSKTSVQTDRVSKVKSRMVLFFWNIAKQDIEIEVSSVKIFSLRANGITVVSGSKD